MTNKYTFADIINDNFLTGFRAYDVCRNIDKVYNIRSINNAKYDINIANNNLILYNEELINNQKIPYIYGNINSYIDFNTLLVDKPQYSICALTKYNGSNDKDILTINNKFNVITKIGHSDNWAGIVDYNNNTDIMYKSTDTSCFDNWVATCVSYDGLGKTSTIIGCDLDNYKSYINHPSLTNIYGNLNINSNLPPTSNSDWALSHILIWDKALESDNLEFIYKSFINYINNPSKNDITFYNNYPRELAPKNCIKPLEKFTSAALNISKQLWAGYYAGDYDAKLNILPNFIGDKSRDLASNMMSNIKFTTSNNIPLIYGSKIDGSIIFPSNSINSNFTICSVTKYTSTEPSSNNMILQSIDNNENNLFYHGHYNNKTGVITYNNTEYSKGYISNSPVDSWVVTCAKNTNSKLPTDNVIINGNSVGLIIPITYINKSQTLTINNNPTSKTYNSDWALSYLLIWDTHLTDEELKNVSNALNDYLKTGEKLTFNIVSTPSATVNTTAIANANVNIKDKGEWLTSLNLTPIQKQLLNYNII